MQTERRTRRMDHDHRAAFEALVGDVYEPLQRYLRRRCSPLDVDDLLNDTLLVLWRRFDTVPDGMELPWCYGVARRCLANHRRGAARRLRLIERMGATVPATSFAWTDDVGLQDAVDRLSEMDREVVRLWAWEQLEPRQIAEVLGATPNAISVRLARIRRRLRADLERQDRVRAGHEDHEDHPELES